MKLTTYLIDGRADRRAYGFWRVSNNYNFFASTWNRCYLVLFQSKNKVWASKLGNQKRIEKIFSNMEPTNR